MSRFEDGCSSFVRALVFALAGVPLFIGLAIAEARGWLWKAPEDP